ncbi:tetratricopeptide repeat protein [Methanofollis sp. UBA420]|jgi:tetratricopeptide (TPR) repeat protein|uniref:tetratricopeptide repeat protein n=1 Tax=Methanofollis sp. UBA420 TaxID=1915514 RepID=UPI00316AED2C
MDTTVALNFFWEHTWIAWWTGKKADPATAARLHLFLLRRARDIGFATNTAARAYADEGARKALRAALKGALSDSAPEAAGREDYLWHRYTAFLAAGNIEAAGFIETMLSYPRAGTPDAYPAPPVPAGAPSSLRAWEQAEKRAVMAGIRWPELYFESPLTTGFPHTQIIPAELEIASFAFATLRDFMGGKLPAGGAESFEHYINDAVTVITFAWFAAKNPEDQTAVLNAAYPFTLEEETLDAFVGLFDDYETLLEEAGGLVRRGFSEEAKTVYAYTVLHAGDPALHHAAYENLAVLFREEGEYEKAAGCAEKALAIREGMPDRDPLSIALAKKNLAEVLYLAGETERAGALSAAALDAAGGLEAGKAAALLWAVASSFRRTGRFEEEYALLTRILDLDAPGEATDAAVERLFSMDQYARPDGAFDMKGLAAIEERRRYLDLFGKGAVLLQAFQFDRAIGSFEAALAISRDADLLRNIAIAHRLYGSPDAARRYLEEVIAARPGDLYALMHLGLLQEGEQRDALIREAIGRALDGGADLALVLYPLISGLVAGPEEEFLPGIDRFGDLPSHDGARALYFLGAGTILSDLGVADAAATCYRRALKANPPAGVRGRILRNMGVLAADGDDAARAADLLGQALKFAPADPTVWRRLAGVRAALGDAPGASAAAREAAHLMPTDAVFRKEKALRDAQAAAAPVMPADRTAAVLVAAAERMIEEEGSAPVALRAYAAAIGMTGGEVPDLPAPSGYEEALSARERLIKLLNHA